MKTPTLMNERSRALFEAIERHDTPRLLQVLAAHPDWAQSDTRLHGSRTDAHPTPTALFFAAHCGNAEALQALVPLCSADAFVELQLWAGVSGTPLMAAVEADSADCVRQLLPYAEEAIRLPQHHGMQQTPLMRAAFLGHKECLEALLAHPNAWAASSGRDDNALLLAARYGQPQCLKALIPSAIEHHRLEDTTRGGVNALMFATTAVSGAAECVHLLLPFFDPKARDASGRNALMHAATRGHQDVLDQLFDLSDWAALDSNGHSALAIAFLTRSSMKAPRALVQRASDAQLAENDIGLRVCLLATEPADWDLADSIAQRLPMDQVQRLFDRRAHVLPKTRAQWPSRVEQAALAQTLGVSLSRSGNASSAPGRSDCEASPPAHEAPNEALPTGQRSSTPRPRRV